MTKTAKKVAKKIAPAKWPKKRRVAPAPIPAPKKVAKKAAPIPAPKTPPTPRPHIAPSYQRDHPEAGHAGRQEIYRFGDAGLVVNFDPRHRTHPPISCFPVVFTGIEVTSFEQDGVTEPLPNAEAIQTRLQEFTNE